MGAGRGAKDLGGRIAIISPDKASGRPGLACCRGRECCRWAARRSRPGLALISSSPFRWVCTSRASASRGLFIFYVAFFRGPRSWYEGAHWGARWGAPPPSSSFEYQASGTGTSATRWRRRGLRAQYPTSAVALGVCMIVLFEALYTVHWPAHLPAGLAGRHTLTASWHSWFQARASAVSPAPASYCRQVPVPGAGRRHDALIPGTPEAGEHPRMPAGRRSSSCTPPAAA